MQFSYEKCKVIHLGRRNKEFCYDMDGVWIKEVEEERDFNTVVDRSLKFSKNSLEARN